MVKDNVKKGILSASDMLGRSMRPDEELDPNGAIAQKLKALYTQTEQEAIPDRFLDLLERLDEAERAANSLGER
ncbi:NepR family anti-sigma factor [Cohaesibacter haloalkalitolerans]|uniref:NepR family anti-sigma factor n=1 Tax=Cohaesibacter haloalkalitolerans TaxID=1162980 RepID=UPI002478EEDA|nr:NepR family anti-sigma factor [Cohaesibacter haloalkalitolerans]